MNDLILKERFDSKAIPSFDSQLVQSSSREQVNVDVNHLSEVAKQKIAENEEATEEEIAITLLKDMSETVTSVESSAREGVVTSPSTRPSANGKSISRYR